MMMIEGLFCLSFSICSYSCLYFAPQEQQSNQLERLQDEFMTPTVINPVEQQASFPSKFEPKTKPDNSHCVSMYLCVCVSIALELKLFGIFWE